MTEGHCNKDRSGDESFLLGAVFLSILDTQVNIEKVLGKLQNGPEFDSTQNREARLQIKE
jgi:hypothetical protein